MRTTEETEQHCSVASARPRTLTGKDSRQGSIKPVPFPTSHIWRAIKGVMIELVVQSYSLSGSSVSQCTGSPDFPSHPVQSQSAKQMSVDSTLLDNLIEQQRDNITASETSSTAFSGSLTKSDKNCAAECMNSEVAQETESISQTQSLP
ncbi:hypothetical protein Btru_027999 [Bulinus truncatus]|nr:hypothetical protein Btru_027999 [Bulinus truncatus]